MLYGGPVLSSPVSPAFRLCLRIFWVTKKGRCGNEGAATQGQSVQASEGAVPPLGALYFALPANFPNFKGGLHVKALMVSGIGFAFPFRPASLRR